jgi:bifunctional non-homologous end joining protein LigD
VPRKPRKAKSDPLKAYREKRDFARTREPKPQLGKNTRTAAGKKSGKPRADKNKKETVAGKGLRFVVQKHAARRVHYDLRLELDGVLKSWAVTRGPSLVPDTKRLAVRTEDHPIKYLDFEGVIPKGEYGGGTMIVWDEGHWEPEFDPHQGMEKGHLSFFLHGRRLKGQWHLVRMKPRQGERTENWLLMKADDQFARRAGAPDILDEETASVLSGREVAEVAAADEVRADHRARAKVAAARKDPLPDPARIKGMKRGMLPAFVEPSLATLTDRVPSGDRWIHEIKFDGYRMQARIDAKEIKLLTRNGLDWTKRFASIAKSLGRLGLASALLDGEIVVENTAGISHFPSLQADLETGRQDRFVYYVFDLLYLEGIDLRSAALIDRKELLRQVLARLPARGNVRFSDHLDEGGEAVFEHASRLGLEGIISKRRDLPYRSGRGDHWLKRKAVFSQEFVIGGYVPSTASKNAVGSLVVGYHEGGALRYAGRVGTGFNEETARALAGALDKIRRDDPPLEVPREMQKGVRWVEPAKVAEVEFRGWSNDRILRQAAFKGLREDRAPAEITGVEIGAEKLRSFARRRESSATSSGVPSAPGSPLSRGRTEEVGATPDGEIAGVRLTHPERLLWKKQGVTKQGLAEFYAAIAEWVLPHLVRRPISLLRCPSGIDEPCFFAKHPWKGLDDAIHVVDVGEKEPMLWIDDLAGLIALVQAGTAELHPWGASIDDLDHPDRLIFDLDPDEDVGWDGVMAGATEVRDRLKEAGLESFLKTTGGKGLHVVVPLAPKADWKTAKAFAQKIANAMAKDSPRRYVAIASKSARRGRIFVDYLRNDRGSTAVGAYSTRAREGATVSVPLGWQELSQQIKSDHFNVDNLRRRLDFLKEDPWAELMKVRQRLP